MGSLGAPELLIVLAVVLVLFGGAKLPQLARSLGQAQREFRSGQDEPHDELPEAQPGGSTQPGGSKKSGGSSSRPPA